MVSKNSAHTTKPNSEQKPSQAQTSDNNMKATHYGFNPTYHEDGPNREDLASISGYAVLEFGTNWCGHCKNAVSATKAVLSEQTLPHIKVIDGQGKRLGRSFKVKLWPTLILLKSGQEIARTVRPLTPEDVSQLLEHIPPEQR